MSIKFNEKLNAEQMKAVQHVDGPMLIFAGAGSGKTRVLVNRTAYLIAEAGVAPVSIMAITFTNKAAGEMRQRIDDLIGFGSGEIWVSTFHSACVRILRRFCEHIGYGRNFSIYDTDDQLRIMKEVCANLEIDTKRFKERMILNQISKAKDELMDPEEYERNAHDEFEDEIARAYKKYQAKLLANNAFDFDDLIVKTVELFKTCPDVLDVYQERYRYLMVDEYQDTNTAQFELVRLLASKYRNLCVVGDDDQSIYKFRGANISNILNFEEFFPDAKIIRLEQNYRSTKNILGCANKVIANNIGRKSKTLWTDNEEGDKPRFRVFNNGFEEAEFVADDIAKNYRRGLGSYKDFAILYRTNAQSRLFEEKMLMANIPYKIVGGVNFYSRMEIKDMIAYLKTVDNAEDDLAIKRIINVPKRGIGAASIAKIETFAEANDISLYDGLAHSRVAGITDRAAQKIDSFIHFIEEIREDAEEKPVSAVLKKIIDVTGYAQQLEANDTPEDQARIENLDEFISKAVSYEESAEEPSLSGFLEEVALIADIDSVEDSDDMVLLMTLHSSKGLEFPFIYLTGLEDGVFPGYLSMEDESELEEERRLAYVGITRAKKYLTMTAAVSRMLRGNVVQNPISRFVKEIPKDMVDLGYSKDGSRPMGGSFSSSIGGFSGSGNPFGSSASVHAGRSFASSATRKSSQNINSGNPYSSNKKITVSSNAGELSYDVGDTVKHKRFGEGIVLNIAPGGRDYEVTVEFKNGATKKMFASFANLEKL